MKSGRMFAVVAGAGTCLGALAPHARASATFSGLGPASRVNGISADGTTAVGRMGGRATRWHLGIAQDLNTFGDGSMSTAIAVSADGSVVVGNAYNGNMFAPDTVAFRWTQGSGAQELDVTGGAYEGWGALATSANGATTVGRRGFGLAANAFGAPFGAPVSTGPSAARGVSADGAVIVGQTRASTADHDEAFRWTSASDVQLLGVMLGGLSSGAAAVSSDGSTIVGWSDSSAGRQAARWGTQEALLGLGDLPGGAFESEALALNASGSVIVGIGTDAVGPAAVRWTGAGISSLQTLLEGAGLDLSGWRLTSATGVSADGLTFVGNGIGPGGQPQAWMATIPGPAVPGAAAMACGLLARRRRSDSR